MIIDKIDFERQDFLEISYNGVDCFAIVKSFNGCKVLLTIQDGSKMFVRAYPHPKIQIKRVGLCAKDYLNSKVEECRERSLYLKAVLQYLRSYIFETTKLKRVRIDGFTYKVGGIYTLEYENKNYYCIIQAISDKVIYLKVFYFVDGKIKVFRTNNKRVILHAKSESIKSIVIHASDIGRLYNYYYGVCIWAYPIVIFEPNLWAKEINSFLTFSSIVTAS